MNDAYSIPDYFSFHNFWMQNGNFYRIPKKLLYLYHMTTRLLPYRFLQRLAFALCTLFGAGTIAHAEFTVCNQSFDVLNVAIGQLHHDRFRTQGWWKIGPNQCANVIRKPLDSRYIYVYAKDVFGKAVLNGSVSMCVAPDRFTIDGEADCLVRGHLPVPFIEVDTQQTKRWTIFIAERVQ